MMGLCGVKALFRGAKIIQSVIEFPITKCIGFSKKNKTIETQQDVPICKSNAFAKGL